MVFKDNLNISSFFVCLIGQIHFKCYSLWRNTKEAVVLCNALTLWHWLATVSLLSVNRQLSLKNRLICR